MINEFGVSVITVHKCVCEAFLSRVMVLGIEESLGFKGRLSAAESSK